MSNERWSLPLLILGRLARSAVPVDGSYGWEPAGALKFTTRAAGPKCTTSGTAQQGASSPAHRVCAL